MDKTLFLNIADPEQRLGALMDMSDEREETKYIKPLTQAELDQRHEQLAFNCIAYNKLDEELKEIKSEFKGKMDPLQKENKSLCIEISNRQSEVIGKLFHIKDLDEGMMNTFNDEGEFVGSRRLRPDERQGRLFISPAVNQ